MDPMILTVVAAALPLLLAASATDASRSSAWSRVVDQRLVANLIRALVSHVSANGDSGADPTYFAHHGAETSPDGYYGFTATLDVYGFTLKHGQGTAGAVCVVLPAEYGDLRTHFFTAWTDDGFIKMGCLNTKCPGFQPEKGAPITPGDAIEHVCTPNGAKQNFNLKIVKDGGASGDWLVHLGLNRDPELIGRFPRSLFTGGFAEKAAAIRFGGMVTAPAAGPAPMGSGYLPAAGGAAASVGNIQLVGRDGRASPVTQDLPKVESKPDAYAVSPIENGKFFYGGPQRTK